FECFRARGPEREVSHARDFRGGELERVNLVVVPASQVHRAAAATGYRHPEDVDEEVQAGFGSGRQQLDVPQVRQIEGVKCGSQASSVSKSTGWFLSVVDLALEEFDEQPGHFLRLFLLHPVAGAADEMRADHPRARGFLHGLERAGPLIHTPVTLSSN